MDPSTLKKTRLKIQIWIFFMTPQSWPKSKMEWRRIDTGWSWKSVPITNINKIFSRWAKNSEMVSTIPYEPDIYIINDHFVVKLMVRISIDLEKSSRCWQMLVVRKWLPSRINVGLLWAKKSFESRKYVLSEYSPSTIRQVPHIRAFHWLTDKLKKKHWIHYWEKTWNR